MAFVAHFVRFPANVENTLRFDKVTESLKVGTFFVETQCSIDWCVCLCCRRLTTRRQRAPVLMTSATVTTTTLSRLVKPTEC